MSTIRRPTVPYSHVPRGMLQDERLSIDTRGMLGYVWSLPEDWQLRLYGPRGNGRLAGSLQAACGVGRDRLQRMIGEAIDAVYLERRPRRDESTGRLAGQEYVLVGASDRVPGYPPHGPGGTQSIRESHQKKDLPPSPPEPPVPRSAPAASRGRGRVVEALKVEGQPDHVIAVFGAWLDQGLRWPDVPDKLDWARRLCADLAGEDRRVLARVAAEIGALQTHRMPPAADVSLAVAAARAGRPIRQAIHDDAVRHHLTRRARQTAAEAGP